MQIFDEGTPTFLEEFKYDITLIQEGLEGPNPTIVIPKAHIPKLIEALQRVAIPTWDEPWSEQEAKNSEAVKNLKEMM